MSRLALAICLSALSSAAFAETVGGTSGSTSTASATSTMPELLTQGYEIKAAIPNGSKFVVFLQKDQSAYACEFVSVTNTKCGAISN
jgi:hypothetical protein